MYQFSYFLTANTTMHPDDLALVCEGREYTWSELNETANRIANGLAALGIKKGDRVAYMFDNCAEVVTLFYATQKMGATALAINTFFLADEITRILNLVDCRALFYQPRFERTVAEVVAGVPTLGVVGCHGGEPGIEGAVRFSDLAEGGSPDEAQADLADDDESQIILTSGTTGTAKIVIRTQRMTRDYAIKLALENENVFEREAILTRCPLFHTGGMSQVLRAAALCAPLILPERIDAEEIFGLIERYGVTQTLMIPPQLYTRLSGADPQDYDLSSVRMAQYTGGKCTLEFVERIFDMFPNARVRATYGSTETGSPIAIVASREELEAKPWLVTSVGVPTPLYEVKIVRPDGTPCDDGEVGELMVRSPILFRGYWRDEEQTARVLTDDGWFHTEDLLKRDADGYYYLVDRLKDMIKSGGENVYAQEVEDVLRDHPSIYDISVVGVPDEEFGEAVGAAIQLEPGAAEIPDAELTAYCKARLPSYKKPRYVAYVDEIPHNVTGKQQKSELRAHYEIFRPVDFG